MTSHTLAPRLGAALLFVALAASSARAQTDYLNTDHGRPFAVQDAVPLERHTVEFTLLPLRAATRGSSTDWTVAPSVGWGILPRTQLQASWDFTRDGVSRAWRGAAVEIEALHALNVETRQWPAIAFGAQTRLPTVASEHAAWEFAAIATRTLATATRVHLNGTLSGEAAERGWSSGVAVDQPLPFRYLLLGAELVRSRSAATAVAETDAGVGLRWQATVHSALDIGVRRVLTGPDRSWQLTFGHTYATGFAMLMPRRVR